MSLHTRICRRLGIAALITVTAVTGGCAEVGAGSSTLTDEGIPPVVNLLGVRDQTGPVSYTGISAARGTALAVGEITEQRFLGDGVTIEVDERDGAFDPQTAAGEITSGLAAGDVTAVLGPQVSSESLAAAPIAQTMGVPIVFTQSGVDNLLTGDMHFRASASQASIWPNGTRHIIDGGASTVAIVNSATNPTYHELGATVIPGLLAAGNVRVVESLDLETTVNDFQAPASRVVAARPDVVVVTLIGPQIPTLVVQLRQAGFTGDIYTTNAMTDEQMLTMGAAGEGLMFPASYSYASTDPVATAFTAAFQAEFGMLPDAYAAEAYDQTWWTARAIRQAGSAAPAQVAAALREVGGAGFAGAQGPLTFENGDDARADGLLVRWDGTRQTLAD